jgi:hypothetical protein
MSPAGDRGIRQTRTPHPKKVEGIPPDSPSHISERRWRAYTTPPEGERPMREVTILFAAGIITFLIAAHSMFAGILL